MTHCLKEELLNRQIISIPYILDGYLPKGVLAI